MRTDVKLGLAVGSILFSVVLVYVLFFASGTRPGSTPTPGNNEVAKASDAAKPAAPEASGSAELPAAPLAAVEPMVSITPTTQPAMAAPPVVSTLNIYAPPAAPAVSSSTVADAATVSPAAPAPVGAAGRDWNALLSSGAGNGELLARSETPMVGGVRGHSADAAPVAVDPLPSMAPVAPVAALPAMDLGPATMPSSATDAATATRHIVKPGETLWSIARETYGNAAYHTAIAKANPRITPSRLKAGDVLALPAKTELPAMAGPVIAAATAAPALDPAKQYRVRANDNLNTICKRLYGNTARVAQLYQLNKERIGPNPSALKLGMVLVLPEAPASSGPASGVGATTGVPAAGNSLAGSMQ